MYSTNHPQPCANKINAPRNLDAFLNIASDACLTASSYNPSWWSRSPPQLRKKGWLPAQPPHDGLPLGIATSLLRVPLSSSTQWEPARFGRDPWLLENEYGGEWAAELVFSSVSMTRNESKRCTAQWVTGGNWDSRQRERDETKRNGTERNRTEQNRTERVADVSAALVRSSFVRVHYGEWLYCFFRSMERKQASERSGAEWQSQSLFCDCLSNPLFVLA